MCMQLKFKMFDSVQLIIEDGREFQILISAGKNEW